jgi:hypothetical protein
MTARGRHRALADGPRPQPRRRPVSPVVHPLDPPRPGARVGLLRLRHLHLRRILRHARRPHRHLRRGRALRGRRPGRRSHDVLGPRIQRLQLDRPARAGARALGRARPRRAQHPPLRDQRAQGVRPGLPLPAHAVRAALRGAAAAVRRGGARRAGALSRGAGRPLHEPDLRGPGRDHALDRRGGARGLGAHDGDRGRGVGRAPALPPRAASERHGRRRRRLRAVDPQAGGRPPADGPDPLARGPGRLRAF